MIKNPGKENFFLNGRKIVLGWTTKFPTHNIPSNWPISVVETKKEIFRLTRLS
jgi:hypothetical protein